MSFVETSHDHGEDLPGAGSRVGENHDYSDPLFYFHYTPKVGSPDTPGKLSPDKDFELRVGGDKMEMPDGEDIEFWGFEERLHSDEKIVFPSSTIRVTEGDIVHMTIKPSKRQHTIHLHGIESDTHNDGVGHTSFEVTGSYTYQFRAGAPYSPLEAPVPQTRGAGTYFYHCHVNTTLHFQMGMYGMLIIDPIEGPGTAFHGGPTYDIASERVWACGEVDPTWRELSAQAGMKGGDAGLNDFNPKYFHITGEFQPMINGKTNPRKAITSQKVATEGKVGGEPILIRYVNTSYCRQTLWFDGIAKGDVRVEVIAADGRGFDNQGPNFAQPYEMTEPIETSTTERYDLLVYPLRKKRTRATIKSYDWVTKKLLGTTRTTIRGR